MRGPPLSPSAIARAAVLGVALAGCDGPVSTAECKAMIDRYVDMTLAADPALAHLPAPQAEAARAMKRALKMAEKSYRQVQDRCEAEVRRHEYRCAMAAPTPNDWEACID